MGIIILLKQETSFDKKYKRSLKISIRWRHLGVNTAAFKNCSDAACKIWQSLPGTDSEDSQSDTLAGLLKHSC